jgi:hypothetical protein
MRGVWIGVRALLGGQIRGIAYMVKHWLAVSLMVGSNTTPTKIKMLYTHKRWCTTFVTLNRLVRFRDIAKLNNIDYEKYKNIKNKQ